MKSPTLAETYRPSAWADVVAQDPAIARIRAVGARGFTGRAFWITGVSGSGKTTIARLLAAEVASPLGILEMDAGELNGARVRDLESSLQVYGMGQKTGRAVIVNESHGLSKDSIRALLVALERIPGHAIWIFTTTADGESALFDDSIDAGPLLSRCILIPLARRDLAQAFAHRAHEIADREGLNGRPESDYLALARKHKNNLRAMLQEVETGGMMA